MQDIVHSLFRFAAIYTCPVPPELPDIKRHTYDPVRLQELDRERQLAFDNASKEARQASPSRLYKDTTVSLYAYVRVHLTPKRFPVFEATHWPDRIIKNGTDYLVLNKPPWLPVAPTVDNIVESALSGAARGIQSPKNALLITSKLDHGTEGLVVVGKHSSFVAKFNEKFVRGPCGSLRKFYRALVRRPPQHVGLIQHRVKMRVRRPGTPYFTLVLQDESSAQQGAACSLVILGWQRVRLTEQASKMFSSSYSTAVKGDITSREGGTVRIYDENQIDPAIVDAYEVNIELITGRTHQIRAQLSAIGSPLLGDHLYEELSDPTLRRRLEDDDLTVEFVDNSTGRRLLAEPDSIGLQAYRLEIGGVDKNIFLSDGDVDNGEAIVFETGLPWWRDGV